MMRALQRVRTVLAVFLMVLCGLCAVSAGVLPKAGVKAGWLVFPAIGAGVMAYLIRPHRETAIVPFSRRLPEPPPVIESSGVPPPGDLDE